uniref:Uncharacterized protein n=1 Tax=Panagrolaimus superbus TaxID=310955 RepID=A0A914Z619_9BILA
MDYDDSPQTSPDSEIERIDFEDGEEQGNSNFNHHQNGGNDHFNEQNDDIEMQEINNDLIDESIVENGIQENHGIYQNGFVHSNTNGFGGDDGVNGDEINDNSDIERVMTPLRPRLSDNEYDDCDSDESVYIEDEEAEKVEVKPEQNGTDKVENGKESEILILLYLS